MEEGKMGKRGPSGIAWLVAMGSVLTVLMAGCSDGGGEAAASDETPAFGYSGDIGPGFWGELTAQWQNCSSDSRQSPIDISDPTVDTTLEPLALDLHGTPLKIFNNGYTIEQEYEEGGTLTFEGVTYDLRQFHFHTLSEHTIDGARGVMELHAVFRNAASGNLAVIGVLYEIGAENEFLALFDDRLPRKKDDVTADNGTEIDVAEALTDTAEYYTYPGSLTTPPCSPIVTWIVLKKPAELSMQQFRAFRDILGNDFRPLLERNGRTIRATP
jgi:carbonic anhydrase